MTIKVKIRRAEGGLSSRQHVQGPERVESQFQGQEATGERIGVLSNPFVSPEESLPSSHFQIPN